MSNLENSQEEEESIFSCKLESSKLIVDVLSCLCDQSKKENICIIEATSDALIFVVTGSTKMTQSRASMQAELFETYTTNSPSISFVVDLSLLLECLQLYGPVTESIATTMFYSSSEAVFKVSLEEGGVVTMCDINTVYADDEDHISLFSNFLNAEEKCRVVTKSEALKEAVQDLVESGSSGMVCWQFLNLGMKLSAHSAGGSVCEIKFPKDSSVFVSFRADEPSQWIYPLSSLLLGMKAVNVANESFIRVNADGIACIQHQVLTNKSQDTYIDFLMLASEEDII